MGYVDITQEQLAQEAGKVFRESRVEDVPNKLWIDYWTGGDQHYLRAIFDGDTDSDVLEMLREVAERLHRRYDVKVVCVAYSGAYTWADVEGWVMHLHGIQ